jgi:hypothetical protein
MAALINPTNPTSAERIRQLRAAAGIIGVSLWVLKASDQNEIEAAFAAFVGSGAGAFIISGMRFLSLSATGLSPTRNAMRCQRYIRIVRILCRGGLVSYGTSIAEFYRLLGVYTGRILKGECGDTAGSVVCSGSAVLRFPLLGKFREVAWSPGSGLWGIGVGGSAVLRFPLLGGMVARFGPLGDRRGWGCVGPVLAGGRMGAGPVP